MEAYPDALATALAFAEQAEDFYKVASAANLLAAKPLLLYYGLMNLAKAFVVTKSKRANFDEAYHGLHVKYGPLAVDFLQSKIEVKRSTGTKVNVYDQFAEALEITLPPDPLEYGVDALLPQDLLGNQLHATATLEDQRFFKLASLHFMQDTTRKEIWLRLFTYSDERKMQGDISVTGLLKQTGLADTFRHVSWETPASNRTLDCLEQKTPVTYRGRASDDVSALVDAVRPFLWTMALSEHPFRQYYLYADASPHRGETVPQFLSIYSLAYYFGSVTRYRPTLFRSMLRSLHGAQIEEFLDNQPSQFLYLLASEFQKQDVAQGPIL